MFLARNVAIASLISLSAAGSAERQTWMAELADRNLFGQRGSPAFARSSDWRTEADRILAHVGNRETD
jgi:hypothetical protein